MFKVSLDPLISFSRSANLIRAPTFSSEKNYLAKRVKCPIYGLYEILLQPPPQPPQPPKKNYYVKPNPSQWHLFRVFFFLFRDSYFMKKNKGLYIRIL